MPDPLFTRTPQCLPIEAIEMLAEAVPVQPEIRGHYESCPYCRNEVAMFANFSAATPDATERADVDWIAKRLQVSRQPRSSKISLWERLTGWTGTGAPRWVSAVAMACLLVAVTAGVYLGNRRIASAPLPSAEIVLRSSRIGIAAPAGDVPNIPAELVWQPVNGAISYHVRLLEVDRTEIWSADAATAKVGIPPGVRAQLKPGRSFYWQVSARDGEGPAGESNLQGFHISVTAR